MLQAQQQETSFLFPEILQYAWRRALAQTGQQKLPNNPVVLYVAKYVLLFSCLRAHCVLCIFQQILLSACPYHVRRNGLSLLINQLCPRWTPLSASLVNFIWRLSVWMILSSFNIIAFALSFHPFIKALNFCKMVNHT